MICNEIGKYLSYQDKRHSALCHKNFDFCNDVRFKTLNKFGERMFNSEVFRESVYSDLKENLKVVPSIENIFFSVVNYAGFRSAMAHILFCNCKEITSKKVDCCDKCNRLICSNYEHVKILTKLTDMPVNSLLIYAPYETSLAFKSAFEMEHKCTISVNSFIARTAVNRSIISDEQQFFEDIFPLSANHPLLMLLNFLVVSSRITVNFLYCELENKFFFCTDDNVKNLVLTVEIICRQYLKILCRICRNV